MRGQNLLGQRFAVEAAAIKMAKPIWPSNFNDFVILASQMLFVYF